LLTASVALALIAVLMLSTGALASGLIVAMIAALLAIIVIRQQ